MQSVGQAWLVLELTGSPFQLGLVTALQFTPILLLSPVGGALSDRFPKRRIILLTQAVMMAQAFVLAGLVWSGQVRYWHVAVLAAIYGLGRAVDIPARQSYITRSRRAGPTCPMRSRSTRSSSTGRASWGPRWPACSSRGSAWRRRSS